MMMMMMTKSYNKISLFSQAHSRGCTNDVLIMRCAMLYTAMTRACCMHWSILISEAHTHIIPRHSRDSSLLGGPLTPVHARSLLDKYPSQQRPYYYLQSIHSSIDIVLMTVSFCIVSTSHGQSTLQNISDPLFFC